MIYCRRHLFFSNRLFLKKQDVPKRCRAIPTVNIVDKRRTGPAAVSAPEVTKFIY
jgi:hypothetical protein